MKEISREFMTYTLSKDHRPCAFAVPGEIVRFETFDCFENSLIPDGTPYIPEKQGPGNPATGPLYVQGAMPGDMLKIDILSIEPGVVGVVVLGPGGGSEGPLFEHYAVKRIPVKDGFALFDEMLSLPVRPMIGVIGVAPAEEEVSAMIPMDHGGNMDCTQIREGATLYLPVFVEGALLSVGDLHAVMGDGEVEECGLEIEGKVTLKVDIIHGSVCVPYPVIETPDCFITIASRADVEGAWRAAARQMFCFLTDKVGIDREKAGMLLTMAGNLIICQTVNPMKTVRMELPRYITKSYGFDSISVRVKKGNCIDIPDVLEHNC